MRLPQYPLVAALLLTCAVPLLAQTPTNVMANGDFAPGATLDAPQPLIANGDFSAPLDNSWIFSVRMPVVTVFDAMGPGFKKGLRLEMEAAGEHPWDVRAATPKINQLLPKGSLIGVRFWARSPQKAQLGVRFQKSQAPYDKLLKQDIVLTPEWKEYRFFTVLGSECAPLSTQFEFHLGFGGGSVEVGQVRVENFGTASVKEAEARWGPQTIDYFGSQERDDGWKQAANARIEKYRKGDLKLRIVDASGKPVSNTTIKLVQTRQLFRWGSAVSAARLVDTQDADNLRYQSEVKRLYNTVVFENDFKWTRDNSGQRALNESAVRWLQGNGIALRGHCLVWGGRHYLPAAVTASWNDTEALRQLVRQRVRTAAAQWKGQVYVWDAVNEAATNTELWDKLGWDEFANVYKLAREVDPTVRLAYNDYNLANESASRVANMRQRARVVELIGLLRRQGAPVDILGDQAHFSLPLTPPARVAQIWRELGSQGVALEVTEYDAGIPDDAVQAAYLRDILTAAFAEPAIQAFVLWGFWEKAHWRAREGGALFRADWSKRPAQQVYEELVLGRWMTKATLRTNSDGVIQTRAFLGDYEATIQVGGQQKTVRLTLTAAGWKRQLAFGVDSATR